jgi:hypothetical protein
MRGGRPSFANTSSGAGTAGRGARGRASEDSSRFSASGELAGLNRELHNAGMVGGHEGGE